jgi:hypothetical protein
MAEMTNSAQAEQTFVANPYGTVTNKRVVYYRAKGWFSGGSREDIPLQHVTSVRLDTSRSWLPGILLFLIGLGMLGGGEGGVKVFGLILLAFAVLLIWGSPSVVVNTAGRDLNASKGAPWTRADANAFVEALRAQLFSK